ncbi:uncharacterized protein LAESUDRAFT_716757 [Laetiporus sulphureus 93-53]|uniref:Uncharacterized protein n=1 Tax=Laetiporus sulphureus 93-53 TaxID=1314785 RepID=A0A165CC11_9APHY|nr:uncharacterized protein LAESUDRAFT_716757 [Laetiporus sulphureus 93-53]KZT02539.1 hypothetical protein LAESUDRAFT_716757 [Laetiporus sulphureus 93-53]
MWPQHTSEYSSLFFAGLQAIASKSSRPSSMIAGPSSSTSRPLPHTPGKRKHARTVSAPHHDPPQKPLPSVKPAMQSVDTPQKGAASASTSARADGNLGGYSDATRRGENAPVSSLKSPTYRPRDPETDSLASDHTERCPSPLTSFLSFGHSPEESAVDLAPKRERRISIQTMPLPRKTSHAHKRRSVVSVDLSPLSEKQGVFGHNVAATFVFDEVGRWGGDDVAGNWRQGTESSFQDDRSFLITSF